MMETTDTTVITPMITPRSVRKLRSLCVPRAEAAMRRVSMTVASCELPVASERLCSQRATGNSQLCLRFLLLFLLLRHLRSILQLAQGLERAGDDLLPF